MSDTKEYTLEIYKTDRRMKEGRRLVAKQEFAPVTTAYINAVAMAPTSVTAVATHFILQLNFIRNLQIK